MIPAARKIPPMLMEQNAQKQVIEVIEVVPKIGYRY